MKTIFTHTHNAKPFCSGLLILLFLCSNEIVAQSNPVLVVNKTSCDLHIWAYCSSNMEDCDWSDLNISSEVIVPGFSTYLFTDVNPPESGCEGFFAFYRFHFPSSMNTHSIRYAYTPDVCAPPIDCFWVPEQYGFADLEEQCIGELGRIQGSYHANPSAGSHCHMVFDFGQ